MIVLSFARWSDAHGIWFTRTRLYRKGRWTPFCRLSWRYKKKLTGFWADDGRCPKCGCDHSTDPRVDYQNRIDCGFRTSKRRT